jgi:hypothetical protein
LAEGLAHTYIHIVSDMKDDARNQNHFFMKWGANDPWPPNPPTLQCNNVNVMCTCTYYRICMSIVYNWKKKWHVDGKVLSIPTT